MARENTASSSSQIQKPVMPPGMVMGPDGKPCKICTAFRNWSPGKTNHTEADSDRDAKAQKAGTQASFSGGQKQKENASAGPMAGFAALAVATSGSGTAKNTPPTAPRSDEHPPGCPPDVEQLGRATWTFLHTTAAYYPEKPTPTQRANMLMLLKSLPVLYPCTWCAQDFGESIEENKPDVSGRVALSRWLCERHNEVNERLGRERFDCAKVDERWKDGPPDGSCD